MAKVVLHGSLKKFGGPFDLGVETAGEAVRALCIMVPGFRKAVADGSWRLVRGKRSSGLKLGIEDISIGLGNGTELHIAPAPRGAGGRGMGAGKIVIGAILIAAVVLTAGAAMGAAGAAGAISGGGALSFGQAVAGVSFFGAFSGTQVALFGAAMLVAGISQLVSPQPKNRSTEVADQKQSYLFNGVTNQTEQGTAVPLVFGKMLAGSVLISAGLDVEAIDSGDGFVEVFPGALTGVTL